MQDEQEVTSETSWNATRGRGEDAWRLEPEGETETLETKVLLWNGVEGVPRYADGEGRHELGASKEFQTVKLSAGVEDEEVESPRKKKHRIT